MVVNGKSATMLELQAIADICFSVVECYSTQDFLVPKNTIRPIRFDQMFECTGRIRLWIQAGHCMALVDQNSQPLIQNIFDDSEILQANSYSAREEEKNEESDVRDKDSDISGASKR